MKILVTCTLSFWLFIGVIRIVQLFSIPKTDVALKAISRRTCIEHLTLIYDSPDIYTALP